MASRSRDIDVGGVTVPIVAWDWEAVEAFAPTIVIDCAFLTRDLVGSMSPGEYVDRNSRLTENMLAAANLSSVSRVITISSGAAVHPVDALLRPIEENPYGWLKRRAEEELGTVARARGISAVVARAWSVSGALVLKPRSYAFSDMILEAAEGGVHITATVPVYRRYVGVEDLLAVAIASATVPDLRVIESGGPLVEMQELAETIVSVVNPAATITRAPSTDGEPDLYYAPAEPWETACAEVSFVPATLEQQAATAYTGLRLR
jgi:nucleoside-diphosphate-sugar epimerase